MLSIVSMEDAKRLIPILVKDDLAFQARWDGDFFRYILPGGNGEVIECPRSDNTPCEESRVVNGIALVCRGGWRNFRVSGESVEVFVSDDGDKKYYPHQYWWVISAETMVREH